MILSLPRIPMEQPATVICAFAVHAAVGTRAGKIAGLASVATSGTLSLLVACVQVARKRGIVLSVSAATNGHRTIPGMFGRRILGRKTDGWAYL